MDINNRILKIASKTIETEAKSVNNLLNYLDDDFVFAIKLLYNCKGRVIISGIGKSAIISQKIVATLNSTGTPSIFLHAADAIHGDLGIIQPDDIVICISKSGDTPEIKLLVSLIKNLGNKIIAIVSNINSFLALQADYKIYAFVENEACPNNIVPTTSTTVQLVLGDAIAVCLLELKGFSLNDFAKFHPGGAIGKKLYMRVNDLLIMNRSPKVDESDNIKDVIVEISSKRLGATAVLGSKGTLSGVITDGDLRRMLEKNISFEKLVAKDIMSINPKTIEKDALAVEAFNLMEKHNITQLIVVENNKYLGMIHIHDILKEGIV
ncbi:MAG: D-arabinose 5-phosphate isomerase [Bacteroidetes bacterium GWA2_31_9]|nr:MAG: D-arabinose 5-phosphate isomerase [Bacteroidetes bacterium GWA2_31_9]